ncbi:MAG: MoxR family ATPase [Desulfurococcaceae archaeon]
MSLLSFEQARDVVIGVCREISKIYVGKKELVELAVATLFSGGHLLIEGYPGTGKTLLAKLLAKVIGGKYKRIQGHPDVLPSDIMGFHIYKLDGSKTFIPGPLFSNILLIDELNRIPTRSQAALLEAMQELQVTIDGETYQLRKPFLVIATSVPLSIATGAFYIMETLVDRFTSSVRSEYNPISEELEILDKADLVFDLPVDSITTPNQVVNIVNSMHQLVHVERSIKEYIVSIVSTLRKSEVVEYGPSHRATIDLLKLSRVVALMDNRDYVIPDDVKKIAVPVIAHRVKIRAEYESEGYNGKSLVEEAVYKTPVPK